MADQNSSKYMSAPDDLLNMTVLEKQRCTLMGVIIVCKVSLRYL